MKNQWGGDRNIIVRVAGDVLGAMRNYCVGGGKCHPLSGMQPLTQSHTLHTTDVCGHRHDGARLLYLGRHQHVGLDGHRGAWAGRREGNAAVLCGALTRANCWTLPGESHFDPDFKTDRPLNPLAADCVCGNLLRLYVGHAFLREA